MKFQTQRARSEYECIGCEKTIEKGTKYVRIGRKKLCKDCGLIEFKDSLRED